MRSICLFLLLSGAFLTSQSEAQLTWSKRSYPIVNFRGERADFTGDGYPDLLLHDSANLSILPNMGNGTFDASRAFVSTQQASTVALLDFNRDGKTDVAACDGKNLVILKGNGDGTLTKIQSVPVACASVVASDFNKDGNPDVAVTVPDFSTNSANNQVIVYLGDGTGAISGTIVNAGINLVSSDGNACVLDGLSEAADFNGDKAADIAINADCVNGTFTAAALIVGLGDGSGHFLFHRDVEYNFDFSQAHLIDSNQDRKLDIIALGFSSAPHGFSSTAILILRSNGDGTFSLQTIDQVSVDGDIGNAIEAFAYGDFDGDGTSDIVLEMDTESLQSPEQSFAFQFLKGQSDGSFKLTQTSPLATQVLDMVPGDYDKDGRLDVVFLRQRSTDVWLNRSSSPICSAPGSLRSLNLCTSGIPTGTFQFIANPLDSRQISAMQLYVDSTLKFETPQDLLNTKLRLSGGSHRITAKGWDDLGPFSKTINFVACINDVVRTVNICSPTNGSSSGNAVHIVASAATSHAFRQLQVYVDGVIVYHSTSEYLDISPDLSVGTRRITVKGWDSAGAFSSTVNVTVK